MKFVLDNIQTLLLVQHTEIKEAISNAKSRPGHDVQIELFSNVLSKVTPYTLWKILQQYRIMRSTSFNRICNKLFISSMGFPCSLPQRTSEQQWSNSATSYSSPLALSLPWRALSYAVITSKSRNCSDTRTPYRKKSATTVYTSWPLAFWTSANS